ncbi:MAG: hypothetical protein R3220_02200 [Balneolaceae bacterium]|nr:hypothetical protein [Balneolaceae bacterium]
MMKMTDHITFRLTAYLIVAGFLLSTLFGQGTHLHSTFDHFFDHGDIHIYVHSHGYSFDHEHEDGSSYDLKDSHNHPISTLSLKSTRASVPQQNVIQVSQLLFVSVLSVDSESISDDLLLSYLDLPPPDRPLELYHRYSFSLRAPPLG